MEKWSENFTYWFNHESDPRVRDWFLMSSPLPTIFICVSYVVAAKLLHCWMKQREAFNIRAMIWCFDFFHLAVSSSLICVLLNLKLSREFNFRCQQLDTTPEGDRIVSLAWWFFLYNFSFFSEIFIFLLGKRHDRITNYFLYHHIALPISIWWIVKFSPTGHSLFFGFVNSAVHVVSFGYLSLIGAFPSLKKHFRWWKMFFHSLLIVRIAFITLHALQLFIWNPCNYPIVYPLIVLINAPFFIVLTISDHLLSNQRRKNQAYHLENHDLFDAEK